MDLSTFNYGAGAQLGMYNDYNKDQYNAQGQSLAPTPPANGVPVANDYANDQRTPMDYKQQARQAQLDTMGTQDTTNKYVFKDGYTVDKTADDRISMSRKAGMAYMENYLAHMGDQTQAIAAGALGAGQAYTNHDARLEREKKLPYLESTGRYNSLDMGKWLDTGDTRDLIQNAGTWTSDGHGKMHNTLTGEVKDIPGYTEQQKLTHVDTGDSIAFVNNNGEVVHSIPKGVKPGTTVPNSLDSSGSDGTEPDDNQMPQMQNGMYGTYDNKNNFKPFGVKEQEHWRAVAQAKAGNNQSATNTIENKNLDVLLNATPEQLEDISGIADQFLSLDSPMISLNTSEKNRPILQAAQQITALQGLSGAALAKAAGLSGLNTEAEFDRVAKAVAQLDRSSPPALIASVKRIKADLQTIQDDHNRSLGVQPKSNSQPAQSGEAIQVKRDANGKLIIGG